MFANTKAYCGLAVNDLQRAREFYGETLGIQTSDEYGLMWLHLAGGRDTLVYQLPDATPASFTILNFEVDDIDAAVDALSPRAEGASSATTASSRTTRACSAKTVPTRLVQGPVRQRAVGPPGEVSEPR